MTAPAGVGNGLTVSGSEEGTPSPQFVLCPLTVIFPEYADRSKETTIALVPVPEIMVAPGGSVHVYESAPGMAGTLYVNPD